MIGPHQRTLELALETVGSKDRLAATLRISVEELERYLQGKPLPSTIFLDALDVVAHS
jgi:hypothetical protein